MHLFVFNLQSNRFDECNKRSINRIKSHWAFKRVWNVHSPTPQSPINYRTKKFTRTKVKDKHSTEKGWGYNRDPRKQAVIAAKRSWRKQINAIHSQLVTRKNVSTLTAGCEDFENKMLQFSEAHEALEAIIEDDEERRLLYEDYETISHENNDTLKLASKRIKDMELEMNSRGSNSSRSTKTSKISHRSSHASSRPPSGNSSLSIARRKRVEIEGDIASLKAKMALAKEKLEMESEHRAKMAELQRKRQEIQRA